MVQARRCAAGPGQPRAGAVPLPRRHAARTASCRPTTGSRVFGGPAWTRVARRRVVPAPVRPRAARLQLGPPEVATSSRRSCGSGSTSASTASGSTSRTAWSRRAACPTGPGRPGAGTARRDDVRAVLRPGRRARHLPRTGGAILDAYDGGADRGRPRPGCRPAERIARYVRPDELHQAFNFDYLLAAVDRRRLRAVDRRVARRAAPGRRRRAPGCCPTTTSSGTRPGSATRRRRQPGGIGADDPQPRPRRSACAGPGPPRC